VSDVPGPFFYSHIKCPICDSINAYTNVRTGSYRVSGKDTDYRPTGVVWTDAACQKYDPLLFFMATCAKCFYTREFNAAFTGWSKDTSFGYHRAKIKGKHIAAFEDAHGLIQLVGPRLDPETHPTESAIIKFILGIHDELLTDRPSYVSLARYLLRIAWLFRGRGAGDPEEAYFTFGDFSQFLIQAKQLLSDIPTTEKEALSRAAAYYEKAAETDSLIEDGLPQVQTAYLIGELSRRAGDFDRATQYFYTAIKLGRELVHGGEADLSTVNQTNRVLTMAVEQARLTKDERAGLAK
jgi:uncharacterized protein (DUF2225 family)